MDGPRNVRVLKFMYMWLHMAVPSSMLFWLIKSSTTTDKWRFIMDTLISLDCSGWMFGSRSTHRVVHVLKWRVKRFSIWILLIELYFWRSGKWFECTVGGFKQKGFSHRNENDNKVREISTDKIVSSFVRKRANHLYAAERTCHEMDWKIAVVQRAPAYRWYTCTVHRYITRTRTEDY